MVGLAVGLGLSAQCCAGDHTVTFTTARLAHTVLRLAKRVTQLEDQVHRLANCIPGDEDIEAALNRSVQPTKGARS